MTTAAHLEARGGDEVGRAVEGREGGEGLGVRVEGAVLGRVTGRPLQQQEQRLRRLRAAAAVGRRLVARGDCDLIEGHSSAF